MGGFQNFSDVFPLEIAKGKLFGKGLGQNNGGFAARDQMSRQVLHSDESAFAQKNCALDGVLELADIAWPVIAPQGGQCFVLDTLHVPFGAVSELLDKMLDQQRDVFAPVAQRWKLDANNVEPIV